MSEADPVPVEAWLPEVTHTADGSERRVGVELEFIGLEAHDAARLVKQAVDGELETISDYEYCIDSDSGAWRIERDQELLKELGRRRSDDPDQPSALDKAAEQMLRLGSELVVPLELVGPPLPMQELGTFQALVDTLRAAGAEGTDDSVIYAFGLQFNPELPDLEAATIVRFLQAFFCLQSWLIERASVDTARRLTRFAEPFDEEYITRVIDESYQPDMVQLIDDYLEHNPTRNRALDLLPLFACIDEERVRNTVDDSLIKARPTFHYRLPNSNIGQRGWSILPAWQDWLKVEALARQHDLLGELRQRYRDHPDKLLEFTRSQWTRKVDQWLRESLASA